MSPTGKRRPRRWAAAWGRCCSPGPLWPSRERVTSPTFTIVNEYEGGRLPLFHFDMYRLGSSEELFDIGWEEYLARGGVCAVEWSENVADALGGDAVRVDIRRGEGDSVRLVSISNAPGL